MNGSDDYFNGLIKATRWRTYEETSEIGLPNFTIAEFNNIDPNTLPSEYTVGNKIGMYTYNYDDQYRLKQATYNKVTKQGNFNKSALDTDPFEVLWINGQSDYKVSNINYSENGNILNLKRNGNVAEGLDRDQLSYNYNPGTNQLNYVTDSKDASSTYTDDFKGQQADNYAYDYSGKLVRDSSQNIDIFYNALGKVSEVKDLTSGKIKFKYDYDNGGKRSKKTVYDPYEVILKETWFVNSSSGALLAIYEKDNSLGTPILIETPIYGLDRIGVQEFSQSSSGARQIGLGKYELKDHLGNVRVVVKDFKDSFGNAIPVSVSNYYPFGGNMPGGQNTFNPQSSRIGYQGQQLEDELGLYAFDLRLYNPDLGRWLTPDPYRQHHSPYLAMSNNPISFVDPDGGWDNGPGPTLMIDGVEATSSQFKFYMNNMDNVSGIEGSFHFYITGNMNAILDRDITFYSNKMTTRMSSIGYEESQNLGNDGEMCTILLGEVRVSYPTTSRTSMWNNFNSIGGMGDLPDFEVGQYIDGVGNFADKKGLNLKSKYISKQVYETTKLINTNFGLKIKPGKTTSYIVDASKTLTKKVAKATPWIGGFVDVVETYQGWKEDGNTFGANAWTQASGFVGGELGAYGGAYVGAIAGSVLIPVPGLGAAIGAGVGAFFDSYIGENGTELIIGNALKED